MVFVCVGQENRIDIVALILQKGGIWRDQINAWLIFTAKGDANIDKYPATIIGWAISIRVQVHADLAASTQG